MFVHLGIGGHKEFYMKKNYLYLLAMVMVAMFCFASCSSDDYDNDDDGNGSSNAQLEVGASNLFFNNQKINNTTDEDYSRINEILMNALDIYIYSLYKN